MMGSPAWRPKTRLWLSVLAAALVALLFLVWMVFKQGEQLLRDAVIGQEIVAVESVADLTRSQLAIIQDRMILLGRLPLVHDYLDYSNGDADLERHSTMPWVHPDDAHKHIAWLLDVANSTLNAVHGIFLVNRAGVVVAATSRESINLHWNGTALHESLMQGQMVMDGPSLFLDGDRLTFIFGLPIRRNDQVLGVIVTTFDLASLSTEAVSRMGERLDGHALVINDSGMIVLHSDPGLLLSRIYADAPFIHNILDGGDRGTITCTVDNVTYLTTYARLRASSVSPFFSMNDSGENAEKSAEGRGDLTSDGSLLLIPDWIVMVAVPLQSILSVDDQIERATFGLVGATFLVLAGVLLAVLRMKRVIDGGVAYAEKVIDEGGEQALLEEGQGPLAALLRRMTESLVEERRHVEDQAQELESERDGLRVVMEEDQREKARLREAVDAASRDLTESRAETRRAARAKSDFLARMSHEIRTPMNAILGLSYLCLQSGLRGRQRDHLVKIHEAGSNLLGIMDDILDFAKSDSGSALLQRLTFRLDELCREVQEAQAPEAARKGLRFTLNLDRNLPLALRGDPLRLRQVLSNLVSNAIKFTEKGEVRLDVRPAPAAEEALQNTPLSVREALLLFRVRDTGIGLREDQIDHLFEAFYQADLSSTRQYGGTGLGLAICKRVVDLYSGRFWVESAPGAGSSFFFTARVEVVDASLAMDVQSPASPAVQGPAIPEAANWAGADLQYGEIASVKSRRVLLVEDNEINREICQELLQVSGVDVSCAENGKEALIALGLMDEEGNETVPSQIPFELVLMDIQMPIMDGLEATRRIRKTVDDKHLPVLAMTAHGTSEDLEKSLAAGMNAHLTKPIDPAELRAALTHWLG